MELKLSTELDEFRSEIRAWLDRNRVPVLEELDSREGRDRVPSLFVGLWRGEPGPLADGYAEWVRRCVDSEYMCPQWPTAYGGRGWDAIRMAIFHEELARARMPRATRGYGEQMVGPAIIVHGSDEQKAYFLPRIISGDDYYIQGFSEPNAGSDLANVQTSAVLDGTELVIRGQKIWTSSGETGNKMFLLCRTDPLAEKHRGISYVLVEVKNNHFNFRPTRQMNGETEFTEEFIDGARAPLFNVIGGLNNGWKVAMTTLGNERGSHASTQHLGYMTQFWDLVDEARLRGEATNPVVRQDLAWAYTQVELMRFAGLRLLASLASGAGTGPESSMYKLASSEFSQRLSEIALSVVGSEFLVRPQGDGYELTQWQKSYLSSRAATIMAGSSQIQRNILAERVLGLPKDVVPK